MRRDALTIVSVYPTLLGTYGDSGNAAILAVRARRRGIQTAVHIVEPGDPVPRTGDIYVLGGGEDMAQAVSAEGLRRTGGLAAAADRGATIFAVCAGFQLLGAAFLVGQAQVPGLGVLDATACRLPRRAVGELLVEPMPDAGLSLLTGFENHAYGSALGPEGTPLGKVEAGVGNGDGTEGARQGHIIATYLHGPALARNPRLADLVLEQVLGSVAPLEDPLTDQLRAERIRAARRRTDRPRSVLRDMVEQVVHRSKRHAL